MLIENDKIILIFSIHFKPWPWRGSPLIQLVSGSTRSNAKHLIQAVNGRNDQRKALDSAGERFDMPQRKAIDSGGERFDTLRAKPLIQAVNGRNDQRKAIDSAGERFDTIRAKP